MEHAAVLARLCVNQSWALRFLDRRYTERRPAVLCNLTSAVGFLPARLTALIPAWSACVLPTYGSTGNTLRSLQARTVSFSRRSRQHHLLRSSSPVSDTQGTYGHGLAFSITSPANPGMERTVNRKRARAPANRPTPSGQDGTACATAGRWELVPAAIIRGKTGASAGTLMDGPWPLIGASRCLPALNCRASSIAAAL